MSTVGTLVAGLAMTTGTAQAAPTPNPNEYYELYSPYFNPAQFKCLDVPFGSHTVGLKLEVYHCHSGEGQLWKFVPTGGPVNHPYYFVVNKASGLCLGGSSNQGEVLQSTCSESTQWMVLPSHIDSTNDLYLAPGFSDDVEIDNCIGPENVSGADHTPVTYHNCAFDTSLFDEDIEQNWRLG